MDNETMLQLIKVGIMDNAEKWVKTGIDRYWGMAAGLTYAYLILTNDSVGYDEYYAVLGVFVN